MPTIHRSDDDHPHKMSEDETQAREHLARGKGGDVGTGYAVLHLAEKLDHISNGLAMIWRAVDHAAEMVATNETRGVTLVRMMPASEKWKATWRCGGSKTTSEHDTRWDALRWAADLPAGVRLILNPDTNDWEPWSAVAIRHGVEGIGEDYM